MAKYIMGFDVGSSSIKASLLEIDTGKFVASAASPKKELEILAPKPGWAEQDPAVWWRHLRATAAEIGSVEGVDLKEVEAVGISYQMHGLVCVDQDHKLLRPAIIWCDSRAVQTGEKAFSDLGQDLCLSRLLNSPGNFTASKLKWVKDNEPEVFARISKIMLPGDYISFLLTGEITTTPSGLSEAIIWDFRENGLAGFLLDYYGIAQELIPKVVPTFSVQGELTGAAAQELGLRPGIKLSYRAGDQPNNALSLNVLNPGEIAATAGTSGVVYGVGEDTAFDSLSRVNTFVHVNHSREAHRYGILLCINGTAILNSWLKHNVMTAGRAASSYDEMNALAAEAPIGSEGLLILPFGNGAERTLENRNIGASIHGLDFNKHSQAHLLRAAQEGIVFALNYGMEIMQGMGVEPEKVRAGHANMFLSPLFTKAFATVTGAGVELYNTDGAQGAARGAGIGAGIFTARDAFTGLKTVRVTEPNAKISAPYREAYGRWLELLETILKQ
ncbi:Xylulose kinase [subsurface metagenome]